MTDNTITETAAPMRLRAEPPRVTRLSRKMLAGVAIVGGATGCPRFCASRIGRPKSPGSAGPSTGPL